MIAIFSEEKYGIENITEIADGNPGVGGSEYLLLQLFYYLRKYHPECELTFMSKDSDLRDDNVIYVQDESDVLEKMGGDRVNILIFIPKNRKPEFYRGLEQKKIVGIAWVHNFMDYKVMNCLENCEAVKRVIFVGRQHYDTYIDAEIIKKSDFIYNMVGEKEYKYIPIETKENIVTYVGVLVHTKGFHKLAAAWKRVVKQVPDAKLYVIGSADLYDTGEEVGTWGITSAKYQKKLARYLADENGEVHSSVHFFGRLGREKEEILYQTKVGVANPTGKSETFCLSAVEFKMQGVPIVSYRGKGLLDTVRDDVDGRLIRSRRQLANSIIELLRDDVQNTKLGYEGYQNGSRAFRPDVVVEEWMRVFSEIENDKEPVIHEPDNHLEDNFKWLRVWNYRLKRWTGGHWKSLAFLVSFGKEMIKGIIR